MGKCKTMIHGIIQNVLNKYLDSRRSVIYPWYNEILMQIQQELIEEIKKEFPITTPFVHVHGNHIIQQKLIGDSK